MSTERLTVPLQKMERIMSLMNELKKELNSLKENDIQTVEEDILSLEKEQVDIEHIIETFNMSASESAQIVSRFHYLRKERRELKEYRLFMKSNSDSFSNLLKTMSLCLYKWEHQNNKKNYQMRTEEGFNLMESIIKNHEKRSLINIKKSKDNVEGYVEGDDTILNSDDIFHLNVTSTRLWSIRNKSINGKIIECMNFENLMKLVYRKGVNPEKVFIPSQIKTVVLKELKKIRKSKGLDANWIDKMNSFLQEKVVDAPEQYTLYYSSTLFVVSDYNDLNKIVLKTKNIKEVVPLLMKLKNEKMFKSNEKTVKYLTTQLLSNDLTNKEKEQLEMFLQEVSV